MKETTEVTEKKYLCVLRKRHKRQKMKIMTTQGILNELVQSNEVRKRILANTFSKGRSFLAFSREKLRETPKIRTTFEVTEGRKCLLRC